MQKFFLLLLSIFFSGHALLAQRTQQNPATFSYGGFQINETTVIGTPYLAEAREDLRKEIDIVNNVGLPPEIITFFRSIPIILRIADPLDYAGQYIKLRNAGHGQYINYIDMNIYTQVHWTLRYVATTVLLHELLHAFHDQRLPDGFNNQMIKNYYNDAVNRRCYDWLLDSLNSCIGGSNANYYLTNEKEFFAVTATTYLFGQEDEEEPHLRQDIQQKQPGYYLYLQQLFGPTAGSYNDPSWSESIERSGLEFEDDL